MKGVSALRRKYIISAKARAWGGVTAILKQSRFARCTTEQIERNCKLSANDVISIYKSTGKTYQNIGKEYNVCAQTVCNIKNLKGAYGRWLIERGIVRIEQ